MENKFELLLLKGKGPSSIFVMWAMQPNAFTKLW